MDNLIFAPSWQDLWSVLAIVLLIGPAVIYFNKELVDKCWSRSVKRGLKGFFILILEYLVVLQFIAFVFDDFYESDYNLIAISFVSFSFLVSWFSWRCVPDSRKEHVRIIFRWIGFVVVMLWFTKLKFEIDSIQKVLDISGSLLMWLWYLIITIVKFFTVLIANLHQKLEFPVGVFAGFFMPIWVFLHWDRSLVNESLSLKIRLFIVMVVEYSLAALTLLWIFYGQFISDWHMIAVLIVSIFTTCLSWYIWRKTTVEFQRWLKGILILCIGLAGVIAIFQLVWDINFFAAARLLFQRVIIGSLIFLKRSVLGRLLASRWQWLISLIQTMSWGRAFYGAVYFLKKLSFRVLIKIGLMVATVQIFSIKPVKRFIKEKTGTAGSIASQKAQQAKDKWKEVRFWTKLFVFIVVMYLLWISPWQILWPMLPKGAIAKLSWLFRWITRLFVTILKKFFGNKSVDFIMLFLAKRISGRVSSLSPKMKHKVKMFLVWKLGRLLIKHNRKRQKQLVFLSKELRHANRKARQLAIDQQKGIYSGIAGVASFATNTVTGTTKAATNLASGTAGLAKDGICATFTVAQRSTIATWRTIQNLLKEALQTDKDPEKMII